ncbi:DUF1232 domain-containing protein [Aneurinibacillus aneurinilyticus]|uniref:DUF1232 domain-containing protein n=2 Tax=Aneurinibacillus aneurinilyticus TaxID=1391 RepID=A0A848CZJ9_ANEAE|nr:DUF1232 domain-containing protein [Aneurinibacillus aneurinilyticus]MED0669649.1 DUF1232 domain-containing protein [Aneurinibacillus aneurinilyticus]MED0709271.1 DUF1232 domain-containing protein [Aneurinibacillus aneurinilyticus]MED0724901.1 DUF1232 domain-containing protein [Aneurinibacillus aneurinilyticus]MED0732484.1 DUF1232 domain-containing protein [Aneurinibacillus aneurinilyticus]MED0744082.1 DUF1232 domain-containing protein [Aneurinibacillus aneurinilyticus]
MSEDRANIHLRLLLKTLLRERSLSMRKLSVLSGIDTATISRIINGKQKANPQHLQKFSECLGVPIGELFEAAGFHIAWKQENMDSDIHNSVDVIQNFLESAKLLDQQYTTARVEQMLVNYKQYAQTEEGRKSIIGNFEAKLQKVDGIGPFIGHLKQMYEKFRHEKCTLVESALMGSALFYFILPVDVIPDYLFPIGYLDDAVAVSIVLNQLSKMRNVQGKE